MNDTQTILYPTDFSEQAATALAVAGALARDGHARLVILHVVPGAAAYTGAGDVAAIRRAERTEEDLKGYREEMRRLLSRVRPDGGLDVEHVIREGDPAAEILRAAEETGSALVVLGTHGRTAEARKRLGSVAEAVMERARCPVVVVRGPAVAGRE
jgi:universal stress protein A